MTVHRYRDDLDEDDLREPTKEVADLANDFEITIRYQPWMHFESIPVTTIEDAFPVIQRVHG